MPLISSIFASDNRGLMTLCESVRAAPGPAVVQPWGSIGTDMKCAMASCFANRIARIATPSTLIMYLQKELLHVNLVCQRVMT
jgi:hypothetical protein